METTNTYCLKAIALLQEHSASLATAESCTGGLLSAAFTAIPGASRVFQGGVIAYTPTLKTQWLQVSPEVISQYGVVSCEVALAMAKGICHATASDWGLATTGVAGPGNDGNILQGTVCMALVGPKTNLSIQKIFSGNRAEVQSSSVHYLCRLLLENLQRTN